MILGGTRIYILYVTEYREELLVDEYIKTLQKAAIEVNVKLKRV